LTFGNAMTVERLGFPLPRQRRAVSLTFGNAMTVERR
jgi:hypothetical protein